MPTEIEKKYKPGTSSAVMQEVIDGFNSGALTEDQARDKWNTWVADNVAKAAANGNDARINLSGFVFNTSEDPEFVQYLPTGLNLKNADLSYADLSGTVFTNVDLSNANLKGAITDSVTICSSNIIGMDIHESHLNNFTFTDNYQRAEKDDGTEPGIDLSNSRFSGKVDLSGTDLTGSSLYYISVSKDAEIKYNAVTKLDNVYANPGAISKLPAELAKKVTYADEGISQNVPERVVIDDPVSYDGEPRVKPEKGVGLNYNVPEFKLSGSAGIGTVNVTYHTISTARTDGLSDNAQFNMPGFPNINGWDYKNTLYTQQLDQQAYVGRIKFDAHMPLGNKLGVSASGQAFSLVSSGTGEGSLVHDNKDVTYTQEQFSAKVTPSIDVGNFRLLAGASVNKGQFSIDVYKQDRYSATEYPDLVSSVDRGRATHTGEYTSVNLEGGLEFRSGGFSAQTHASLPVASSSSNNFSPLGKFASADLLITQKLGSFLDVHAGVTGQMGSDVGVTSPTTSDAKLTLASAALEAGLGLVIAADPKAKDQKRLDEAKEKMEQLQNGDAPEEPSKPKSPRKR